MKAFTQMKDAAFGDKPKGDGAQLSFEIGLGLQKEQRRTGKNRGRGWMDGWTAG